MVKNNGASEFSTIRLIKRKKRYLEVEIFQIGLELQHYLLNNNVDCNVKSCVRLLVTTITDNCAQCNLIIVTL